MLQAIVCIILGLIFNINKVDNQKSAEIINNVSLAISVIVVAINIIISVLFSELPEEAHFWSRQELLCAYKKKKITYHATYASNEPVKYNKLVLL